MKKLITILSLTWQMVNAETHLVRLSHQNLDGVIFDYEYREEGGGATITRVRDCRGAVQKVGDRIVFPDVESIRLVVPSELSGRPVVEIAPGAFAYCMDFNEIMLPSTLKVIGQQTITLGDYKDPEAVFKKCSALERIVIPEGAACWPFLKFEGCTALREVVLLAGLKETPTAMFEGCTNLVHVKLPQNLEVISCATFEGCTSLEYVNIPSSVKTIGLDAFRGCAMLKRVDLPDGLQTIKSGAFADCPNLRSIKIPISVIGGIESGAFEGTPCQWLVFLYQGIVLLPVVMVVSLIAMIIIRMKKRRV